MTEYRWSLTTYVKGKLENSFKSLKHISSMIKEARDPYLYKRMTRNRTSSMYSQGMLI